MQKLKKRYRGIHLITGESHTGKTVRRDNALMLERCLKFGAEYILIDEEYYVDIEL